MSESPVTVSASSLRHYVGAIKPDVRLALRSSADGHNSARAAAEARSPRYAQRVLVAESVTEVEGHGLVFSEPKTYERRSVTLPRFLREELGRHLDGRRAAPDEFLFTSPTGGVLRHRWFYRTVFKPSVTAAGFRRTFAFTT